MCRLNERQVRESIGFHFRGEDQISVPERFHISLSTLSRLRRWMQTTGSLNVQFRTDCLRAATRRQDQEIPLRHIRNRFQEVVKIAVHF
jgi:hypothetical protein